MKYWLHGTISFAQGVGHFRQIFHREGGIAHQPMLVTVTAVSCGIKISAVHYLVLSQYTRLTDRQRDRWTDKQTDRTATALPCVALHAVAW